VGSRLGPSGRSVGLAGVPWWATLGYATCRREWWYLASPGFTDRSTPRPDQQGPRSDLRHRPADDTTDDPRQAAGLGFGDPPARAPTPRLAPTPIPDVPRPRLLALDAPSVDHEDLPHVRGNNATSRALRHAQAVLTLRAVIITGDFDPYWALPPSSRSTNVTTPPSTTNKITPTRRDHHKDSLEKTRTPSDVDCMVCRTLDAPIWIGVEAFT